jgi:hypothetical protein
MTLLIAQVTVAANGNIRLHRRIGRWGIAYGCLVIAGIWLSPIFIGMLHDWITRRRIHPVYTIGSIALFLFALRLLVARSEPWLRIGRPIIDALQ